jgi:hypothetical protein
MGHETGYARQDRDFYPTPAWPIEAAESKPVFAILDIRGELLILEGPARASAFAGP